MWFWAGSRALQQGGGRVAPEVGAHLVDLVEQDDRVHGPRLLDRPHDPAGQRADVRPPVAADLGLVADAAEGDADELAAHRVGDGLSEAGLADAGRADQGQYGTAAPAADHAEAPVAAPLAHGQVLGDALLHVLQARVLGVEHGLGALDVVGVLGALAPRHLQDRVEPGADPGALGRLVGGPLQLVDLLERGLADLLGQVGGLDPGAVVVGLLAFLLAVDLAQLLADGFELAAQQELALLLVDALLDVLGDGLGHVLLGEVVAQLLGGDLQAGDRVGGLQQFDLLLGGQERRVAGVVGERGHVVDGLDPVDDLPGAALAQPGGGERLVLLHQLGDLAGQRIGNGLVDPGALDPERGARAGGAGADAHPAPAADQGARVAVGQAADLLDRAEHAGGGVRAVDARDEEDAGLAGLGPGGGLGGLHRGPYLGVAQVQGDDHAGQDHFVVERQHGQGERCEGGGLSSHDLPFGSQVELHRLNEREPGIVPQALFAVSDQVPGAFPASRDSTAVPARIPPPERVPGWADAPHYPRLPRGRRGPRGAGPPRGSVRRGGPAPARDVAPDHRERLLPDGHLRRAFGAAPGRRGGRRAGRLRRTDRSAPAHRRSRGRLLPRARGRRPRWGRIAVVEREGAIIDWHRAGPLAALSADALADPRAEIVEADLVAYVNETSDTYDALCLDIDNGPGWTVTEGNDGLYAPSGLAGCARLLRPGGVLAVWSAQPSPEFEETLRNAGFQQVRTEEIPVARGVPDVVHIGVGPG